MPTLLHARAAPPTAVALSEIAALPQDATGLWLDDPAEALADTLLALRRHPALAHLPLFTREAPPLAVAALADGRSDDPAAAAGLAAAWQPAPQLVGGDAAGPALRLARYLYLRPGTSLRPHRDWRHPATYHYPLVDAFADDGDAAGLLRALQSPGWLAPLRLVDRLRRCGRCHGSHLNYVDVCPRCRGLDIVETRFLHCFTCAHVAPEVRFRRDEQLICPNCLARLRHIGADYNRPLEQQHCRSCEHMFLEALVVARCLACDHEDTPERLPVSPVHEYGLSDRGHQGAREGVLEATANALARPHQLDGDSFRHLLDWQLNRARREGEAQRFSLLGLELEVPPALVRHLGNVRLAQMLEAFALRLGQLLRDTDFVNRPADLRFRLLLPGTAKAGLERLLERIALLAEDSRQAEAPPLRLRTAAWSAPADLGVGDRATDLLAQLEDRLREQGG